MVDQREKEMAEMRARYAKLRGKKTEEPTNRIAASVEEEREIVIDVKPIKKPNPYIRLIKGDINSILSSIKKLLGYKKKSKPLDLSWLEKNDRRFWK